LQRLGHPAFKPLQFEALEAVMLGRSVLLAVATNGGKSAIYSLLGLLSTNQRVVFIISPTVELIKSQLIELEAFAKRQPSVILTAVGLGTISENTNNDARAMKGHYRWGAITL
jgi:hypothetical protein